MTSTIEIIFWVSAFFVVYTYVLYPVILFILCRMFRGASDASGCIAGSDGYGSVSMVVAAYNEEKVIYAKLRNCMEIDYPADKIEFLIGSDGSTDRTNEIVSSFLMMKDRRFRLLDFPDRKGKASVLNRTIAGAKGEFLVFSDANTLYERDAVRRLVAPFADPGIGCVCGKLVISRPEKSTSNDDLYWKYETWMKVMENRLGGVLGVNGGIYALRKQLYVPIPTDTIIDDFVIGMKVREQGFRVHYAEDALASEETAESDKAEFKRRVRIGAGNFQSIALLRKLLCPREGIFAFQFWSHKIIRWCVPFFMILLFLSNIFLLQNGKVYLVLLISQVLFYLLAIIGYWKRRAGLLFRVPSFFVAMNLAFLIGFFRYLFNVQKVTWERTERLTSD